MLEIEFGGPQVSVCECCGKASTRLTRFVSQDGEAFAVYYAACSEGHPEQRLIGVVSLGEWWKDEVPDRRVTFAFEMWSDEDEYKVGIIDADKSQWGDVAIIGKKLNRAEALEHPWLRDVFHITDHMTDDDPEIKRFFEDETITNRNI